MRETARVLVIVGQLSSEWASRDKAMEDSVRYHQRELRL